MIIYCIFKIKYLHAKLDFFSLSRIEPETVEKLHRPSLRIWAMGGIDSMKGPRPGNLMLLYLPMYLPLI